MGLDTSHDCWHGPYSRFMAWREWLHCYTAPNPDLGLKAAWDNGDYADQSLPINVLMNHSDCDGQIPTEKCAPLADALSAILADYEYSSADEFHRVATAKFIDGLRLAASKHENVEFH